MNLTSQIGEGLEQIDLTPTNFLVSALETYVSELMKWNKTFNLTAIREESKVVSHHLLDSLIIHPYVTGETIIDVGTGAGFPGIPLALLYPEKQFTLLDSNGKKTRFLQQMKITLGLSNCHVVQSRVEEYEARFDQLTCRAFAALTDITQLCSHLVKDGGQILALKGKTEAELQSCRLLPFEVESVYDLAVPSVDAERHLVVLRKRLEKKP